MSVSNLRSYFYFFTKHIKIRLMVEFNLVSLLVIKLRNGLVIKDAHAII